VRSIAPDANPYMVLYTLLKAGLEGPIGKTARSRTETLPDNIQDAIDAFRCNKFVADILGQDVVEKYADLKQNVADRSPRRLGTIIKTSEIQFHHEVTNQYLWGRF
jgi:glutamine synthetase